MGGGGLWVDLGNGPALTTPREFPSAPQLRKLGEVGQPLSLWSRLSPAKWWGMGGGGLSQGVSCRDAQEGEQPLGCSKNTPKK